MSPFETIVLAGILAAFGTFGVMLAWAEYQTRHLPRESDQATERHEDREEHWKAAA